MPGGILPDDVVTAANELRQRMLRVLDYHFADHDEVAEQLADIRVGRGYADLRDDLMRLGELYEEHSETLAADARHYRAEDRALAGRLAHAVYQVLGDGRKSEISYWTEYHTRAWSLLLATYDEVSALGRWLYRHEDGATRFPSLYSVGRRRRGANGGSAEDGGPRADVDSQGPANAGAVAASGATTASTDATA